MGSGGSKIGDAFTSLGNKITDTAQLGTKLISEGTELGTKQLINGAQVVVDKFGNIVKRGWDDITEDITNPLLRYARPLSVVGGKIFDLKREFIEQLPFSNELLSTLENVPYVGDKIKLLDDVEKFLKLIENRKYKQAQEFMIKKGLEKYVGSKLPNNIKNKMYERVGLDTV
jgi:hypothetical protein